MFKLPKIGPAILITAAFIGPGTVITASLAGANYGYSLLWALLFSIGATIILQEMAARLGVVTQKGLGENLRESFNHPLTKWITIILIVSAIVIGNSAYQSGNISGASLGLASLFPNFVLTTNPQFNGWAIVIGTIAFTIMWRGHYILIERAMMLLVGLMSLAFLITFLITQPKLGDLLAGLFIPSIPSGASLTVITLIGTTVVPYNLFLHADSAKQKWCSAKQLKEARQDLFIAIPLGGLISIAIVSTAAAAFFGQQVNIQNAADLSPALQPLFGDWAQVFMAIGLFSAGISSAITAPLAAAYALSGILNLSTQLNSLSFKLIWICILLIGVTVSCIGYKPVSIIWFAQVANGILLPVICSYLLWTMNQPQLAQYRNSLRQNIIGGIILMITFLLSGRSLLSAFGLL
ncbi:Nramp family divalent metal transporter [Aliikangiella sp. IMCC44359]|uniref:Nramp family divalent metal transporter n=1 Tax=Aliikangiella sp. IMCC44359 TaxID=3459125 RepID=UPI00403B1DA0